MKITKSQIIPWVLKSMVSCFLVLCLNACGKSGNDDPNEEEEDPATSSFSCGLEASPTSGTAPVKVYFTAWSNPEDVSLYEIDFDGDGTYDYSSGSEKSAQYTYTKAGSYTATLRVTDKKGKKATTTKLITVTEITLKYPEFKNLKFFKNGYWKYYWESTTNNASLKKGYRTITLGDSLKITFSNNIGELVCYAAKHVKSGDAYSYSWKEWPYLAVKEGVIYGIEYNTGASNYGASILFNAQTGKSGDAGYMGYFSASRTKTVLTVQYTNYTEAYSGRGVMVLEPYVKNFCETIAGVRICDDYSHDYEVKEIYLPAVGFCGFIRSGTSIFQGGGYGTKTTSFVSVGLVESNIK